jgi:cation diffusion facilitator CzcD-associated flavoprotein CzcO
MTPNYPPACKRLVIAQDFYPAIQKDNVEVVSDAIDCIEPRGVRLKNGRLVELDVLVYSTGFWPYKVSMDIVGKDGMHLSERLEGSPVTYRTICVPGFPNFFTLFGPYSPIGNNSIIENSERQIGYVMKCLELIASGRVRSLDPKLDVALRLKEEMRRGMQGTVWSSGCDSWYLDANGDPIVYPFGWAASAAKCASRSWTSSCWTRPSALEGRAAADAHSVNSNSRSITGSSS